MKHDNRITFAILLLFLGAQIVGLFIVHEYIDIAQSQITGEVAFNELPSIGSVEFARPDIDPGISFLYVFGAVVIGTILLLVLVVRTKPILWKVWFFLAVLLTLFIAFTPFITSTLALLVAVVLALIKIFKPNVYVHNFTELFIYGGIAAIFVPVISLTAMWILLVLISLYDMYAVWKSKHMIKMAKFQAKSGVFAGLLIPYHSTKAKKQHKKGKPHPVKTAVLGGGDIAFPLLFAGVVMKSVGLYKALIIPPVVTLALAGLLYYGKKDTFYPAMPFISIGCVAGYLVMLLF
jgi:presenilin-like A22 family membrane protease